MLRLAYTIGRCPHLEKKKDQYPCYMNVGSNHPKKVFKQIPNSIIIRLSINSSNEYIFIQNKHNYEIVDKKKNSDMKIEKTIQIYRIRVIIGKGKSYGSHLHITWL